MPTPHGCLRIGIWLLLCFGSAPAASLNYGAMLLTAPGCNSVSFAQLPESSDLFVGRQLLTANGSLAGVSGPNDCSGGRINRWGLTLDRLDWSTGEITIVKPLLDTSVDPTSKHSRSMIAGGLMRGARIMSAYDADAVAFHGQDVVVYECTIEEEAKYGVIGTSSCLSIYNPTSQQIDLTQTQVIISGDQLTALGPIAAAVPHLLVFRSHLYLFWSAIYAVNGSVTIRIRGCQLVWKADRFSVKNGRSAVVHSLDAPTTEVWTVDDHSAQTNVTVDLRAVWTAGGRIVAAAGLGGTGCISPGGRSAGCFRLAVRTAREPLANDIFNRSPRDIRLDLPSNPQEYTRPVRDPHGRYWWMGHFFRPPTNGVSDAHPAPDASFWRQRGAESALVLTPFVEKSLWP